MEKAVNSISDPESLTRALDYLISFLFAELDNFKNIETLLNSIKEVLEQEVDVKVFLVNDEYTLFYLNKESRISLNESVIINDNNGYSLSQLNEVRPFVSETPFILKLHHRGKIKGFLVIEDIMLNSFQLQKFNFIVQQINYFLDKKMNFVEKYTEDLEQKIKTLTQLNDFSLIISSIYTDEPGTLQRVIEFCASIFGATHSGLFLISRENEEVDIVSGWENNNSVPTWLNLKFALDSPMGVIFNEFLYRKKIVHLREILYDNNLIESLGEFSKILNVKNTTLIPLYMLNSFFGFLALRDIRLSDQFNEFEELALTIAHMLSSALHNAKLYKNNIEIKHYLSNLIRNSRDAIVSLDLNGKIILWNEGAKNIFGFEEKDITGKNFYYLFSSESRSKITGEWIEILTGRVMLAEEAVGLRKDGQKIELSYTFSPINDTENKIVGISIIFRDLTEKKKLEKDISESKNRLQTVFDNLNDQILLFDLEHKIIMANKIAFKFCNLPPRNLIGKNNYKLIETLNIGNQSIVEYTIVNKKSMSIDDYLFEGKVFNLKTLPVFDSVGKLTSVIVHARDLTEEKNLQTQLFETEKMAVVGNITAGITHEFSDPLSIIIGCTEELKSLLEDNASGNLYTEKIIENVQKISSFIDNLSKLVYKSSSPEEKVVINISPLIKEIMVLIERHFTAQGISLTLSENHEILNIYGYFHQLQKAFLNIFISIFNPFEADGLKKFHYSGSISVSTALVEKDINTFIKISFVWKGNFINILNNKQRVKNNLRKDLTFAISIINDHGGELHIEEEENIKIDIFLPTVENMDI